MVPSIRAYSKSGSPDRHAKMRSKTPPFTQRRNRWKTLFQRPKSPGRSRHGAPVRTRHSTASRNSRLSLAVAPGSDALPGNRGATFSQAASPTTNRTFSSIAPTPPKRSLNHGRSVGGIPQCQQALSRAPKACLIIDDTGLPKKGLLSVGVARQYCGALGKKANCQCLVSLTLAQGEVPVPAALRLFLPEDWTSKPDRCAQAGVPEADRTIRSKGEIPLG